MEISTEDHGVGARGQSKRFTSKFENIEGQSGWFCHSHPECESVQDNSHSFSNIRKTASARETNNLIHRCPENEDPKTYIELVSARPDWARRRTRSGSAHWSTTV
jgi:hypothetical protein